jgi:hypothetical protein
VVGPGCSMDTKVGLGIQTKESLMIKVTVVTKEMEIHRTKDMTLSLGSEGILVRIMIKDDPSKVIMAK